MIGTVQFGVLIVCCLGYTSSQVIRFGGCPKGVNVVDNFDINRYMGKWYEQERFFAIFEFGQTCGTAEYTLRPDDIVTVNNTGYNRVLGNYVSAIGDAIVLDPSEPAKLGVKFFSGQPRGDYWVLDTDYEDFSVVWSCSNVGGILNTQFCWILSRKQEGLSPSTRRRVYRMLKNYGINAGHFSMSGQTQCPAK